MPSLDEVKTDIILRSGREPGPPLFLDVLACFQLSSALFPSELIARCSAFLYGYLPHESTYTIFLRKAYPDYSVSRNVAPWG